MPQRNRHSKNKERRKLRSGNSGKHHTVIQNGKFVAVSVAVVTSENEEPSNMELVDVDLTNPLGNEGAAIKESQSALSVEVENNNDDDDNGSSRGCPEVNVLTGKKEFSLYQDQIIQSTISFLKICLTSHMYNVYIYLLYMYASIGLDDQEEEDWVMV